MKTSSEPKPESAPADAPVRGDTASLMQRVFVDAPVGIALVSPEGRFLEVNPRFAELVGRDAADILGRHIAAVTAGPDRSATQQRFADMVSGRRRHLRLEKRYERPDGSIVHGLVTAAPVRGEGAAGLGFVAFIEDVTERKVAEDAATAAHDALKDQMAALARSKAQIEKLTYVASHDLQEPLRIVAGFTELLAEEVGEQLDERSRGLVGRAVDACHRLQRQVRDLVEYTRIAVSAPARGRSSAEDAFDVIAGDVAFRHSSLELRLHRGPLPHVALPPEHLELVLRALIDNAVKFRRGDSVRVTLTGHHAPGQPMVSFDLSDEGRGFPGSEADAIFHIFRKLDPATPGSGVGLAIARNLVEAYGGRIDCISEPDAGATFSFSLPIAAAAVRHDTDRLRRDASLDEVAS